MAKKQTYYYILVMTEGGPVFVTSVEYNGKTAHWDMDKKPMEFGKYQAEDITMGLNLNFHNAFTVSSKFELDSQPYRYNIGEFEWKYKEDEKTA